MYVIVSEQRRACYRVISPVSREDTRVKVLFRFHSTWEKRALCTCTTYKISQLRLRYKISWFCLYCENYVFVQQTTAKANEKESFRQ